MAWHCITLLFYTCKILFSNLLHRFVWICFGTAVQWVYFILRSISRTFDTFFCYFIVRSISRTVDTFCLLLTYAGDWNISITLAFRSHSRPGTTAIQPKVPPTLPLALSTSSAMTLPLPLALKTTSSSSLKKQYRMSSFSMWMLLMVMLL